MNSILKAILIIGLLAAAGGGAWALLSGGQGATLNPVADTPSAAKADDRPAPPPELVKGDAPRQPATTERKELTLDDSVGPGDQFAQGVTGRIVTPNGAPVADARVMLVVSPQSDILKAIERHKKGIKDTPIAIDTSRPNGEFNVGVENAGGKTYDVWILHPDWADKVVNGFKPQNGDWQDTGDIVLNAGAILVGQVTDEASGAPIANAQVTVESGNNLHNMVSIPGREAGIVAVTDGAGMYRIANAQSGIATVSVDDPRYASVMETNVGLKSGEETRKDFRLSVGFDISGIVVSDTGEPVAGAEIRAASLSVKQPQNEVTTSGGDGRFVISGLRDGAFQLSVSARNYQPFVESPVLSASATNLELVVESKNSIGVRVTADNGARVNGYNIRVLRWFPANKTMGMNPDFAMQKIRARDLDNGIARIEGIDYGHYILEVNTAKWAKSFSEPFELEPGGQEPIIDVVLVAGATLVGRVMTPTGEPVVGAHVVTEPDGQIDLGEGGLASIFGDLVKNAPKRIGDATAKTGANGTFQLDHLPYGDYQLRISHPEYVGTTVTKLQLAGPGSYDAPDTILEKGCIVTGLAGVNSVPSGQLKIRIATPNPQPVPGQAPTPMTSEEMAQRFSATGVSLSNGTWRIAKRVPPGTYEVVAERMTTGPFEKILDHRTSKQTVVIAPGQERAEVNINISVTQ